MKWLPRDVMLALRGLTATAGVVTAGISLYRALAALRVLVSVGTVGTRALSGIQDEAQGRRRNVLQVLAAEDSAGRRAHSAEALRTDARIATHSQELVNLDASDANRAKVAALRDDWRSYTNLRKSVISLALASAVNSLSALSKASSNTTGA